jgi:hypothetical protein
MKYNSGRVYEGQWEDDIRCGKGYERYPNNNSYIGEFKKSKPWGKGVYRWSNGEVYDGEWYQGLKHGYGIWKGIYGDSYIGEWKNSRADGYGVHTWSNGDRYEGEWKACLKHGNGTDIFSNGDIYIGHYKDGKPDGYGQYIWAAGSSYVGYFKDGLKHGKGKWKANKGTVSNTYEGEYYNDSKQGDGVFRWASGNVYVGKYKNDERDGYGEMTWTDGSKYVGEWKNGIQNGYGKMIFPNGTVKEGYFDNNIFKGKNKPEEMSGDNEIRLNTKIDTIERENLWEKYGQARKSRKLQKHMTGTIKSGNGWYNDQDSLPEINMSSTAYENDGYNYNMINASNQSSLKKRKQNTGSHTQISFNRGRTKEVVSNLRQNFNSTKRPRISTAATSTMKQKRRNLGTTSTDARRKKPNIPKYKPKVAKK